jgi:large subunit ribosomal protein L25
LHVDFIRVTAGTRTHVNVQVVFDNQDKSPGLKRGGVLNVVRHDIELVCAADNIPDQLHVDVSGYDIGDSIHISAVALPEGTTPAIADRDFTIATIAAPTVKGDDGADTAAAETPAT